MHRFVPAFPAIFVFLWATGFLGARYAMPHAEPFTFLAIRFALAAALIAIIALLIGAKWPSREDAMRSAITGILIHGIYLGGVFWAVRNGMPAGLSALVIGVQPIITALFAYVMVDEKLTWRLFAGLVAGLTGIAMVIVPKFAAGLSSQLAEVTPLTLGACVLSVVTIAFGTVWQKRHAGGVDLRTGTFWQFVGALIVTAAASTLFERQVMNWTGELVFALLWLTVVLSIGAIFLLMFLIREGAVSRVSSLFYLVPSVTAVMAWFLFGETLKPLQIAGLAVSAAGVWLATGQGNVFARRPR